MNGWALTQLTNKLQQVQYNNKSDWISSYDEGMSFKHYYKSSFLSREIYDGSEESLSYKARWQFCN